MIMSKMIFSQYVLKVNVCDKKGNRMFEIYDSDCSIVIDETIYSLLTKICYSYNKVYNKKIEVSMIYIFTPNNFNILSKSNIRSPNILNDIIDDYHLSSGEVSNMNESIYSVFGFISKIDIYMLNVLDEISNILNFFQGRMDENKILSIYNNYISIYFPLLNINSYKSICNSSYISPTLDYGSIHTMQREINELDIVDETDIQFFSKIEIKNLFLIYTPIFKSKTLVINKLINNIVFVGDMFLDIFENMEISKEITSIVLQSPQLIAQKGTVTKLPSKSSTHHLVVKGSLSKVGGLVSFTVDLEIYKCRVYLSFYNHKIDILQGDKIQLILDYITSIFNTEFVTLSYNNYNIDFFNVKSQVANTFNMIDVNRVFQKFTEYMLVLKSSDKSIYTKYKVGYTQNVLSVLYNNLYSILNQGGTVTKEQMYKFKVDYNIDYDELNNMINDINSKINSSYRDRGVSISLTDMYVNISGLTSSELCVRILFVVNRLINLGTLNKSKVVKVTLTKKLENEYMRNITMLDKFLQNKDDKYWCKACQNYGNKIRKPIMYRDVPDGYTYDKNTNTYINKKGYRVIKMDDKVYFGCNTSTQNLNKYIGFIKTCSLCCFQEDQFTVSSNVARRKIKACWDDKLQISSSNYIYTHSKMVGDISMMLDEFAPYFDDQFVCKLIKIGPLTLQPKLGELVFIDSILVNPSSWSKDIEYSIYIYQSSFLHKVIRHNKEDKFTSTPIDSFIANCSKTFNIIVPHNCYNLFHKYKSQIIKYSFIENMNAILFIFKNGIQMVSIDRTLQFGEYVGMFGDLKYVNKYDVVNLADIVKTNLFIEFEEKHTVTSIIINSENLIYGIFFDSTICIIFSPIDDATFNKITVNKYSKITKTINITIALFTNSIVKTTKSTLLNTDEMIESYLTYVFKYHFFIYLNVHPKIKSELIEIVSNGKPSLELFNILIKKVKHIVSKMDIIHITDEEITNIEITNDISISSIYCTSPFGKIDGSCKLKLNKKMLDVLINNIINEIMYPYSSLYVYMSKYINNSYSPYNIQESISKKILLTYPVARLIGNQYIQEIYQFGSEIPNIPLFRAFANIYFWSKLSDEKNHSKKNLGYFSDSQTYLAHYIHSILRTTTLIDSIKLFELKFKIEINVSLDSDVIYTRESPYYIYINITNGHIVSLSVGFAI